MLQLQRIVKSKIKTEVRLHDAAEEIPPWLLPANRFCTYILYASLVGSSATRCPKICGYPFCQPGWRICFHLSEDADQVRKRSEARELVDTGTIVWRLHTSLCRCFSRRRCYCGMHRVSS